MDSSLEQFLAIHLGLTGWPTPVFEPSTLTYPSNDYHQHNYIENATAKYTYIVMCVWYIIYYTLFLVNNQDQLTVYLADKVSYQQ